MRVRELLLEDIIFDKVEYRTSLYDSVYRIGFSIPIKIEYRDNHYYCIDGHKRLSILEDILKKEADYKRGHNVRVVIVNNGDIRSNDASRRRNIH